jgi:ParB-like chromosome segregation protein Spo0J
MTARMTIRRMKVGDIKVRGRVRNDLGDLTDLCRSIEEVGLLHPVVVTADDRLVSGERRIAAFKQLGRDDIPAVVAENLDDALLLLKAERDENVCRKGFTPGEAVALGERMEKQLKPAAETAKKSGKSADGRAGGRGKKKPERKLRSGFGKVSSKVAPAVGMKARTYEKAKAVVAAAESAPAEFEAVVKKMNDTGNVDAAFREVKRAAKEAKRQEAAREAAKLELPGDLGVRHGDFREVVKDLADDSVDLVFTDPPYHREYLPLYGELAREAARFLKPGGSLVCYLGQYQIHEVCALVTPHLRLWWTLCCLHTGQSARMTEYGVVVKWKPMLWFVKGTRGDKETMVEDLVSSRQEKDVHDWQQGLAEAAYYVDKLTPPGGFVFDPFCGGGTTAVAAKRTGRRWLTCDTDGACVPLARRRIHESGDPR